MTQTLTQTDGHEGDWNIVPATETEEEHVFHFSALMPCAVPLVDVEPPADFDFSHEPSEESREALRQADTGELNTYESLEDFRRHLHNI